MKNNIVLLRVILFLIISLYGCSTNNNNTTTAVPAAPSNLTASVISTTQVNLSWTDNATNESGYKVQRKTSGGSFADVGSTGADISTFSDMGLNSNNTYTYRVYAYNSAGNSSQYSNEVTVTTSANPGNQTSVTIGTQIWSSKNLDVDRYRNGDPIPQVTDPVQWTNLTTGAWCYYNNDPAIGAIYGKLYNWYAVNDSRGLAPQGWHVPTNQDWFILISNLGGGSRAGGAMKEAGITHWVSPNTVTPNSSGFSGLPGGIYYSGSSASFGEIGYNGFWWSTSEFNFEWAWCCNLTSPSIYSNMYNNYTKKSGLSVRLVKD